MAGEASKISCSVEMQASGSPLTGMSFNDLVSAFKEALTGVDVELDDQQVGRFVRKTVTDAIYN